MTEGISLLWNLLSPTQPFTALQTYFYKAVAELLAGFLQTKAANTVISGIYRCTAVRLCKLYDHKSLMLRWRIIDIPLMLRWRTVSGHSGDVIANIEAEKGSRSIDYVLIMLPSPSIYHDGRPTIVDALLTLIFRTW